MKTGPAASAISRRQTELRDDFFQLIFQKFSKNYFPIFKNDIYHVWITEW